MKTEWKFENTSNVHSGSLTLEPDRIYEVKWEEDEDDKPVPIQLNINGEYYQTYNFFQQPYKGNLLPLYKNYIYVMLTNPMRIRVNKNTVFGIVFSLNTISYINKYWFYQAEFWKGWFKSWLDPVAKIKWEVHDITDDYKNNFILFDNSFHISGKNN